MNGSNSGLICLNGCLEFWVELPQRMTLDRSHPGLSCLKVWLEFWIDLPQWMPRILG